MLLAFLQLKKGFIANDYSVLLVARGLNCEGHCSTIVTLMYFLLIFKSLVFVILLREMYC